MDDQAKQVMDALTDTPMDTGEILAKIGADWAKADGFGPHATVEQILVREGAVRQPGGRWTRT